ncbi:hypothetical protein HN587_02480 [Candidatus Woesearchaeota archaeon]|nr:hypothetical protein [Candidatus Woesearchaeota archaeon]
MVYETKCGVEPIKMILQTSVFGAGIKYCSLIVGINEVASETSSLGVLALTGAGYILGEVATTLSRSIGREAQTNMVLEKLSDLEKKL